ncbi:MAG: tyrosine-protein phosphatase [Phycisphaerae bacterium]|nr:tyrosine-protein phosphatase [Phycisphaerae bacterium]
MTSSPSIPASVSAAPSGGPIAARSSPARRTSTFQRVVGLLGALCLVGAVVGLVFVEAGRLPKRFAAVVPGQLYRSGELTPRHVAELRQRVGLARVISLLDPTDPDSATESDAERAACERLGIRWENVPMRGNGDSTPEARSRLLDLLRIRDAGPTLVHCAAGANRTGVAIGLHRVCNEGWTADQALAEMERFDFKADEKHRGAVEAIRAAARPQ